MFCCSCCLILFKLIWLSDYKRISILTQCDSNKLCLQNRSLKSEIKEPEVLQDVCVLVWLTCTPHSSKSNSQLLKLKKYVLIGNCKQNCFLSSDNAQFANVYYYNCGLSMSFNLIYIYIIYSYL